MSTALAPAQVDSIISRLEIIEQQHQRIALVRNVGLGLIVVGMVVLGTRFYNLYEDITGNKEAYAQEIGKALKTEYQPQLVKLSEDMTARLRPLLETKTKQVLEKWSPKIMTMGQEISDENKVLLQKHVNEMTKAVIADLYKELNQGASQTVVAQNLVNLDTITARLTPKIQAHLDAKIRELTPSIQKADELVKQIGTGAESQNLTVEKAQRELAEAILDVLRFELNPALGDKPATLN